MDDLLEDESDRSLSHILVFVVEAFTRGIEDVLTFFESSVLRALVLEEVTEAAQRTQDSSFRFVVALNMLEQ